LLGQTLHEWARETSWPALAHLCVCFDPAVQAGSDEIILRSSDLDFPVTTDSAQVRAFLAAEFDGVKLVFSTYQSAHVVAAGMKPGESFDLAIFDEAHKTAGREGVHFGFALSDKNLAIRKRLFLTATPRHYDIRKRDREGDARLVYSMDAPEIYGPVAHQLTFAEAARRGIICHYRVIISVVTSGMVN
jgi:predicted helicase